MEIVIKSGFIVDGSGDARFKSDIGIEKGKIVEIGSISSKGDKEIDASGLIVAPGFIDIHSHSDVSLLIHRRAESSIRQGVTTEAICTCGNSPAPVSDKNREWVRQRLTSSSYVDLDDLKVDWTTSREFLNRLERQGIGVNVAYFVGHGAVRSCVLGVEGEGGEKGWINDQELQEMKSWVEEAMQAGDFGMTTGLMLPMGRNAHAFEIIELCKVVAKYDGLYMSHLRSSGPGNIPTPIDAIEEFIYTCEKANVRGDISHLYTRGGADNILKLIEDARARGVDVTFDMIPFIEAGARQLTHIFVPSVYHHFISTYKKPDDLLRDLRDAETFKKIKEEVMERRASAWDVYENYTVAYAKNSPQYVGKTLVDIAEIRGVDYVTAARDLLLKNEGDVRVKYGKGKPEEEFLKLLTHPVSMPSRDFWASDWQPSILAAPATKERGTFPNVLGKFVRERKVLTLEDAIKKITSLPAHVLRLKNRGQIKKGIWADITIFDADKIRNRSTIAEPFLNPEGIECVLVNGEIVLEKGKPTGTIAGKVLRLTKQ